MGTFSDTDKTVLRVSCTDEQIRDARDDRAYWNILGFAKEQPDAADWARDVLSALGLDGDTASPPSPCRLIRPDGSNTPGGRPATATRFPGDPKLAAKPTPVVKPKPAATPATKPAPVVVEHIEGRTYRQGCRCPYCRETNNAYQRKYRKRHRDEARVAWEARS